MRKELTTSCFTAYYSHSYLHGRSIRIHIVLLCTQAILLIELTFLYRKPYSMVYMREGHCIAFAKRRTKTHCKIICLVILRYSQRDKNILEQKFHREKENTRSSPNSGTSLIIWSIIRQYIELEIVVALKFLQPK